MPLLGTGSTWVQRGLATCRDQTDQIARKSLQLITQMAITMGGFLCFVLFLILTFIELRIQRQL